MTTEVGSLPDDNEANPETTTEVSFPQELLAAIPEDKRDEFRQKFGRFFLEVRREEHYSGPLQPAKEAAAWDKLVPGTADRNFNLYERQALKKLEANDRILTVVEDRARHDMEMEKTEHSDSLDVTKSVLKNNSEKVKRGQ